MIRLLPLLALLGLVLASCGHDEAPLVAAVPVDSPSPFRYPVALWDHHVQGETVVLVHVTAGGNVDSVHVARSSGHGAFDDAAVAGAYRLRFLPAHRSGETLPMWLKVPVRFSRDTVAADSAQ